MAEQGIQVHHLSKRFGPLQALKRVSFSIEKGQALGILGSNGAGKTTLINILTTVFLPDTGTACIDGYDIHDAPIHIRKRLGVVAQNDRFDTYLTLWENLSLHAELHGMPKREFKPRIDTLLEQVGLQDRKNADMEQLSGGMKRKASLIRALIHEPDILFLDEPTTGLDPLARRQVWDAISAFKAEKTIVLTSHYMEEANELCDELLLMDKGEVLMQGTPDELKDEVAKQRGGCRYAVQLSRPLTLPEQQYMQRGFPLSRFNATLTLSTPTTLCIQFKTDPLEQPHINQTHWMSQILDLLPPDQSVQSFHQVLPSLDDVFFSSISSDRALLDERSQV